MLVSFVIPAKRLRRWAVTWNENGNRYYRHFASRGAAVRFAASCPNARIEEE